MSRVGFREKTNRQQDKTSRRTTNYYVDGTAAPKLTPLTKKEEKHRIRRQHAVRKNRDKAHYMNIGFVSFTICSLLFAGAILFSYIHLQSDVTNRVTYLAKLEKDLNNLKLENDEEYNRIMGSVDLEEIKRVAINELGMRYAKDGQVVTYTGEGSDYVRQYSDIP